MGAMPYTSGSTTEGSPMKRKRTYKPRRKLTFAEALAIFRKTYAHMRMA